MSISGVIGLLLYVIGAALVITGVWLVFMPAALIAAGAGALFESQKLVGGN